jgi:serine/threonine protein phosphatase PrpC
LVVTGAEKSEARRAVQIRPKPVDVRTLKLTPEQGFVLSRIMGPMPFSELVAIAGLEEEKLAAAIHLLADQGAIECDPPFPRDTPPPVPAPTSGVAVPSSGVSPAATPSSFVVCGISDVGMVRTNNEDAFAVLDVTTGETLDVVTPTLFEGGARGVALIVSDGMGGENAGEVASALVLETMRDHLMGALRDDDPAASLASAVEHANTRVAAASDEPGREGMGATLIALLVHGTDAYTAEVGDSRAYLLRSGALTPLSKDQTQIQVLIERGLLTPESAKTSKARNVVLQAIGKLPDLVVAQRKVSMRDGDRFLLCSDGLTTHVNDDEIAKLLAAPQLDEAVDKMIALAKERGGKDNVTVVVAMITGGLPPPNPAEPAQQTITMVRAWQVPE